MNKQVAYTFQGGMNQDLSKSKHPPNTYYDAKNIRIFNTDSQSSLSASNEKGNSLVVTLPTITINSDNNTIDYNDKSLSFTNSTDNELLNSTLPSSSNSQKILGYTITRDSIILISSDDAGFDCIWEVNNLYEGEFDLELLYCRDLNLSINNPVQIIFNYENEVLQKIYWVDGINQLRFLNIKHSKDNGDVENLIDLTSNAVNIVSDYSLSQPVLNEVAGGGTHTAGMIQYSYNLYRLNGSQTTISPLSDLIALDNGDVLGGGELNEIVGRTPFVNISTLDENYTHIRIYAIKYTSYNEVPSISLIKDEQIDSYIDYTFNDDGSTIEDISLSEFTFLGSNPTTPKHIESKDNRLFVANYKESSFVFDIDARSYSHDSNGNTILYTGNVSYSNNKLSGTNTSFNNIPITSYNYSTNYDAINPDYNTYVYQKDGSTRGGEGLYFKYEISQVLESNLDGDIKYLKFFKDDEIYRIGIQFYNKLGQVTDVKWVADFKSPIGNLKGSYNTLVFEIKDEYQNYIDSLNLEEEDTPVGYKIVRAQRDIKDMTILCQGSLTGMMVQTTQDATNPTYWENYTNRKNQSSKEVKMPIPFTRGFSMPSTEDTIHPTENLKQMSTDNEGGDSEIYKDPRSSNYHTQNSWQYTKMMQLHSPDILFDTGLVFGNGLYLKTRGMLNHTVSNYRYQRINVESLSVIDNDLHEDVNNLKPERKPGTFGMIGPIYDGSTDNTTDWLAYNRQYTNFAEYDSLYYNIYGSPEVTDRGQGSKAYNGDAAYTYNNTLEGLISDRYYGKKQDDEAINSINSYGSKCTTIVLGSSSQNEDDRTTLEDIATSMGNSTNSLLLGEIVRATSYIYTGALYGGLSNEDKARTTYIEIGEYQDIDIKSINIESCGDIFVQNYEFGRILKTDTDVYSYTSMQITETVQHPVETTVNLLNRNDISLLGWDNKFQPSYDEFHEYNRVYSQNPNVIINTTDTLKAKKVEEFNNRISASKLKVPGEFIDNWTDFLEDETMDLDGKYGSINSLKSFNDTIYALQDRAVAKVSINPRVQTQASDGLSIELGSGSILYDYDYLSTDSGTLNKWSVFTSPYGLYYFDLLNKSYNKLNQGLINLSSTKGLNDHFQNNNDYSQLIIDNPLLRQGVIGGYDSINKEALLTVLQGDDSYTVGYSDKGDYFTSFYDFLPSMHINRGFKNLMVDSNNDSIYTSFEGNYNEFFGVYYPSYITVLINPESNLDCIFDNIEYNSEIYLNDIDQPEATLTHLTAWNEYQDSGKIELVLGRSSNLRRKFRKWRADIPRDGRQRMRNPWLFLKLELDTTNNYKFILHDLVVKYTV